MDKNIAETVDTGTVSNYQMCFAESSKKKIATYQTWVNGTGVTTGGNWEENLELEDHFSSLISAVDFIYTTKRIYTSAHSGR